MSYRVEFSKAAIKELKKLDRVTASMITGWIRKNLGGCSDPRAHGKALVANHQGKWRYRVGDYRILAVIQDDRVLILVVHIGHRSSVYGL